MHLYSPNHAMRAPQWQGDYVGSEEEDPGLGEDGDDARAAVASLSGSASMLLAGNSHGGSAARLGRGGGVYSRGGGGGSVGVSPWRHASPASRLGSGLGSGSGSGVGSGSDAHSPHGGQQRQQEQQQERRRTEDSDCSSEAPAHVHSPHGGQQEQQEHQQEQEQRRRTEDSDCTSLPLPPSAATMARASRSLAASANKAYGTITAQVVASPGVGGVDSTDRPGRRLWEHPSAGADSWAWSGAAFTGPAAADAGRGSSDGDGGMQQQHPASGASSPRGATPRSDGSAAHLVSAVRSGARRLP
jgi:hypothetical protein